MTEITVDAVRQLIPFLGNTAGEGAWRFVIIDPADELNRNAANALLKALEEPPVRTFLLLIANRPGALPATVRSRCRRLDLHALDEPALDAALAAIAPDILSGSDGKIAKALSGGSPRLAIELARKDGVAIYRGISEIVSRDSAENFDSIASRAADTRGGGYHQFMNAFETYLHRRVRGYPEPEDLPEPPELPLVTWAALWEKAARSAHEVEIYNLDRKEFALELLEAIMAARRDPLPVL